MKGSDSDIDDLDESYGLHTSDSLESLLHDMDFFGVLRTPRGLRVPF